VEFFFYSVVIDLTKERVMQYLLTEEEYRALKSKAENSTPNDKLHLKCIKAACSIKISLDWGTWEEKPQPWGCPYAYLLLSKKKQLSILNGELDEEDVKHYIEYCDECPVQDICPSARHWSQ